MFPKMLRGAPAAAALVLAVGLAGCSGEDPPGGPPSVVEEYASMAVDAEPDTLYVPSAEPDVLLAPWTLTGPDDFTQTGNGDTVIEKLVPGRYELAWGDVPDWVAPAHVVRTILGTKRARLEGRYTTAAGSDPLTYEAVEVDVLNPGDPPEQQYTVMIGSPADVLGADEEGNIIVVERGEPGRSTDESQRRVLLQTPFEMATTEVTNGQYVAMAQWALDNGHANIHWDDVRDVLTLRDALDGSVRTLIDLKVDPALIFDLEAGEFRTSHPERPVTAVTWFGAAAFCDWLSLHEGLPRAYNHSNWRCNGGDPYGAEGYRLPTEAEWEHACRGRSVTAFANGAIEGVSCDDPTLSAIGWYCGNSGTTASAVEHPDLTDNAFGLYDMHGNVWEWCNDLYGEYPGPDLDEQPGVPPLVDPTGALAADSTVRVIRGGGWRNTAANCRSARRNAASPALPNDIIGFRPVRSTP